MQRVLIVLAALVAACGGSNGGGSGDGSDVGTNNGDGSSAAPGTGSDTTPVYADAHPRIYLAANKARLAAAFAAQTPAAVRFKQLVDTWMAGGDVYEFPRWN